MQQCIRRNLDSHLEYDYPFLESEHLGINTTHLYFLYMYRPSFVVLYSDQRMNIYPFKYEAQTALFKDPVRTAQ